MKNNTIYLAILLAATVFACTPSTQTEKKATHQKHYSAPEGAHVYTNPTGDEFPILAWGSLPSNEISRERYEEMREAGFNLSYNWNSLEGTFQSLELSEGTGVKQIVYTPSFGEKLDSVINCIKDHPSLAGYFIMDEPTTNQFPEVAEAVKRIRQVDDSHMIYLNLLPMEGMHKVDSYTEYVERYINEVGTGLVSWDIYPVLQSPGIELPYLRTYYYANLEICSAMAKKYGEPLWAFSLSVPHNTPYPLIEGTVYPIPRRNHMRLQVFSDLAYGAQCIQYFTYWTPGSGEWDYYHGPLECDGKRTETYDLIKELNHEVQALSWVFLGCDMIKVSHTGNTIPEYTQPLTSLPDPIKKVASEGEGLVVSELKNGTNRFLMLVNRDLNHPQKVTVETADCVNRVLPDGSTVPAHKYTSSIWIEAGDMLLFQWSE